MKKKQKFASQLKGKASREREDPKKSAPKKSLPECEPRESGAGLASAFWGRWRHVQFGNEHNGKYG